jgi:hypothetical protein
VIWLAAVLVVVGFIATGLLVTPAARRTGLGPWHPAVLWLILHGVFFGIGSIVLAIGGQAGSALYVGAAAILFAAGVSASDRLARRRTSAKPVVDDAMGDGRIRRVFVVGLVVLGIIALIPTLVQVGIPFFAKDITGARVEIGGLDLQLFRVTLPGAVLVAVIGAARAAPGRRRDLVGLAVVTVVGALLAELALAIRYLAAELVAVIVVGLAIARRPVPGRVLVVVGLAAAVVFVMIGILRAYDQAAGREVAFGIDRTVNRIVMIEPRTLDALQAAIPADQPFFGGLTWLRRAAPLIGRDDVPNLGYWIYPRLFPGQSTPGYAAPGLIGEAWANFGWAGLTIFAALGVAVERLAALMAVRRRFVADIVAGALITLFVARTHALGLDGLGVLVALVIGWRVVAAPPDGLGGDLRRTIRWQT